MTRESRIPTDAEIDVENEQRRVRVLARLLPFWRRDTKAFGKHGPRSETAIRILIVVVAGALVVMGVGLLVLFSAVGAAHKVQQQGHDSRLHDETVLKNQLKEIQKYAQDNRIATRDLACSVVIYLNHLPESQRSDKFIQFLSDRYSCQGYVPVKVPFPLGTVLPTPTSVPSTSTSSADAAGPGTSRASSTVTLSVRPAPRSTSRQGQQTVVVRTAAPPGTHTPAPRPTSTRPAPVPSSSSSSRSVICTLTNSLLGICILP